MDSLYPQPDSPDFLDQIESLTEMPRSAIVESQRSQSYLAATGSAALPRTINAAGPVASKRYFEYFTVTIRNGHAREGYFRLCCCI